MSRSNQLATDEVFGPVLSILPFEDEADAIQLASGTEFGLMAGIWCKNGSRALRVARQIKAGQVYINAYGAGGGIELPFRDKPIIRAVSDPAQTGQYRPSGASPLGRVALPDDVPSVVCMLPGEGARYITGTTIPVDCGTIAAFVPPTGG